MGLVESVEKENIEQENDEGGATGTFFLISLLLQDLLGFIVSYIFVSILSFHLHSPFDIFLFDTFIFCQSHPHDKIFRDNSDSSARLSL
jgi:hypothetical protein